MALLSAHETNDLEMYFGPAEALAGASTFGALLARQEVLHTTSDKQVVDTARSGYVLRELAGSTDEHPRLANIHTPWMYMDVSRAPIEYHATEDEIDAQEAQAHRLRMIRGRIGRLLDRLKTFDPHTVEVLRVLYGDEGCRWQQQPQGRIWALAAQMPPAVRALKKDIAHRLKKKLPPRCHPSAGKSEDGKPLPPVALQHAEVLALLAQEAKRPVWRDLALDQAESEQRLAERAWSEALDARPTR